MVRRKNATTMNFEIGRVNRRSEATNFAFGRTVFNSLPSPASLQTRGFLNT
jgi:hypothetical protein